MAARRPECSICMDSFKNPKLISCHHSFCCKCLEDYVRVNRHNDRFDCPLCRTSVELPKGGVSAFQTNVNIETHLAEKFICDLCGPQSVACKRCLDCNENLCISCCHAHEKSKASRDHKISDLGTLDFKLKGKIRQRVFCGKHPEKDLELVCRQCKVLICYLCKAVNHDHHATYTISDAAAEVKKTLQTMMDSCPDMLRRLTEFKQTGQALVTKINDTEQKEIQILEEQRLQLMKILDQEVAIMKDKIQSFYKDLRKQTADSIRDMEDDFKKYSNAQDDAQKLIRQVSDIDIVNKGPYLEQLISTAISKTHQVPKIPLERDLYLPAKIKPRKMISLIGIIRDSTKISIGERHQLVQETANRPKLDFLLTEEKVKREREKEQIKAFRKKNKYGSSDKAIMNDMCTKCQGWTVGWSSGYRCKCGRSK